MTRIELKKFASDYTAKYPALKNEIQEYVQLAMDNIEDGDSETHECYLAIQDIEYIIKEHKNS
jgi:hypothetical protein